LESDDSIAKQAVYCRHCNVTGADGDQNTHGRDIEKQCSRKRVQQLKNVKSHFLDFEKKT